MVDKIPAIKRPHGRPRKHPLRMQGDRAYGSKKNVVGLRNRGIQALLAFRRAPHGSGLGKHRWVVERTLAWLHQYRRLRVRFERRADIHEAFLWIAFSLIIWKTYL
jgi:transposase